MTKILKHLDPANHQSKRSIRQIFLVSLFFLFLNFSGYISGNEIKENKIADESAAELLSKILSETQTFEANFTQSVFREKSDIAEVTTGRFLIKRPNQFRWETVEPFEQIIVADGIDLWTFDPELEQATIQNQNSVLADSPLLLLTSSVTSLTNAFEIAEIDRSNAITKEVDKNDENLAVEVQLFSLMPKQNSLFESVHILIKDNKINEFFLTDTLGGRTSVEFENIKQNKSIDLNQFNFVPPQAIDIIDSREVSE